MRFLLDENFPKAAGYWLESMGHEAIDFRGTPSEGMPDVSVFAMARELDAVLLTTDRDFFHTVRHEYDSHPGLIVVALRQPSRKSILARLEWLLSRLPENKVPNRAFQLRDSTWICDPALD